MEKRYIVYENSLKEEFYMGNSLGCKLYYLVPGIKESISLTVGLLCSESSFKC